MVKSFGEWWLEYVEIDIQKKYGPLDQIFKINNQIFSKKQVIDWINTIPGDRWIKYQHISNNLFQLKGFYPDPHDDICHKIIEIFFASLYEQYFFLKHQNLNKEDNINNTYYLFKNVIYTKKQIFKEVFFMLKHGNSKIIAWEKVADPNQVKKRIIIEIIVADDEMYHRIANGYLVLEYKD